MGYGRNDKIGEQISPLRSKWQWWSWSKWHSGWIFRFLRYGLSPFGRNDN